MVMAALSVSTVEPELPITLNAGIEPDSSDEVIPTGGNIPLPVEPPPEESSSIFWRSVSEKVNSSKLLSGSALAQPAKSIPNVTMSRKVVSVERDMIIGENGLHPLGNAES